MTLLQPAMAESDKCSDEKNSPNIILILFFGMAAACLATGMLAGWLARGCRDRRQAYVVSSSLPKGKGCGKCSNGEARIASRYFDPSFPETSDDVEPMLDKAVSNEIADNTELRFHLMVSDDVIYVTSGVREVFHTNIMCQTIHDYKALMRLRHCKSMQ